MSPRRTDGGKKPARLRAAERRSRALALRIAGRSTPEIASELGIGRQHAWRILDTAARELAAEIGERAEQLRALEAERLEELHRTLWPMALAGDLAAVDRVLRVRESYRRLLGLDLLRQTDGSVENQWTIVASPPWMREEPAREVIEGTAVEARPELGDGRGGAA